MIKTDFGVGVSGCKRRSRFDPLTRQHGVEFINLTLPEDADSGAVQPELT